MTTVTSSRIPTHLPVVVRPAQGRAAVGIVAGVVCLAMALGTVISRLSRQPGDLGPTVIWVVAMVADIGFVWVVQRQAFRGPLLAADESGVWIRRSPLSAKAVFVPWDAVRRIHPYSWMLFWMIRIEVHPVVIWPVDGPLALLDRATNGGRGGGVLVPAATNVSSGRLLYDLYHLSRGRVLVD